MKAVDKVEDFFVQGSEKWFDITAWPRWMRRVWIITLPISLPLYGAVFLGTMILLIIGICIAALIDVWK